MTIKGGTPASSHLKKKKKKHLHQSCNVIFLNSKGRENLVGKLLISVFREDGIGLCVDQS